MTSNFSFLDKRFPVLANFGALAEQYCYSDPNSCLIKLGMIGETIVNLVFTYDKIPLPYAVHGNTDEVHIHFVMNQIGLDGSRYQGKKLDYYNFINHIQSVTHLPVIPSKK